MGELTLSIDNDLVIFNQKYQNANPDVYGFWAWDLTSWDQAYHDLYWKYDEAIRYIISMKQKIQFLDDNGSFVSLQDMKDLLIEMQKSVSNASDQYYQGTRELVNPLLDEVKRSVNALTDTLSPELREINDTIQNEAINMVSGLNSAIISVRDNIKNLVQSKSTETENAIKSLSQTISDKSDKLQTSLSDSMVSLRDSVNKSVDNISQSISDGLATVQALITKSLDDAFSSISLAISKSFTDLSEVLKSLSDDVALNLIAYAIETGGLTFL